MTLPIAINSRIALSIATIGAASAVLVGATFAFFSDTATSTGNVLGAGTLDLQIANSGDPYTDDTSLTFNTSNLLPGESVAKEFNFKNNGSASIAEIAMGVNSTPTDPGSDGSDIRSVLDLAVVVGGTASGNTCTGGSDITSAIDLAVGDNSSPLTLAELHGDTYDSLAIALAPLATDKVCIQATLNSGATNIYQGDSSSTIYSFIAHQDLSQ